MATVGAMLIAMAMYDLHADGAPPTKGQRVEEAVAFTRHGFGTTARRRCLRKEAFPSSTLAVVETASASQSGRGERSRCGHVCDYDDLLISC